MKKINRCLSSLLIIAIMLLTAAGCGSDAASDATPDTASDDASANRSASDVSNDFEPEETYTIGYNYFGAAFALLSLSGNSQFVIDSFGNKGIAMNDEFSAEKIVQDVENMISSGVDGLILWLPYDSLYPTVAEMCEKAQIPFVFSDKIPNDEAILKEVKANPYFVGAAAPGNSVYGSDIAGYAITQGYKTCIITSSGIGDASDTPRLEAFIVEFEASGGEILAELHADSSDTAVVQIEDALVANPEVDFIYGVSSEFGIAACSALENMGVEAKVLTSGLESDVLSLMAEGKYVEMVNGDFWVSGMLSAVILQNYLDGTPLLDEDGNVPVVDDVMPFEVPVNMIDLYNQYFINEYCYSAAEIRQMSGRYNPDFNYDAFLRVIDDYSLENRFIAKYKEGKITEKELEAVGISIR